MTEIVTESNHVQRKLCGMLKTVRMIEQSANKSGTIDRPTASIASRNKCTSAKLQQYGYSSAGNMRLHKKKLKIHLQEFHIAWWCANMR